MPFGLRNSPTFCKQLLEQTTRDIHFRNNILGVTFPVNKTFALMILMFNHLQNHQLFLKSLDLNEGCF